MKRTLFAFLCLISSTYAVDLHKDFTETLSATTRLVKAGGGIVYGYKFINTSAAAAYVHFYDASAAANVSVGTTVQIDVVGVPATGAIVISNYSYPQIKFTNGLVIAATTGALSTSSTTPSTALVSTVLYE